MNENAPGALVMYTPERVPVTPTGELPDDGDTLGMRDLTDAWRHWWWLAVPAGVLLAAIAGATVWVLFKPTYQAAAWVQIEDRRPYVAFPTSTDNESKLFVETQVELIRSPLVLSRVLTQPEIARLPEVRAAADGAFDWLSKQVQVKAVGRSELFQIIFSGQNSEHSAQIANAVAEKYLELQSETAARHADKIIRLLVEEKDRRENELEQMQQRVRRLAEGVTGQVLPPGAHSVVMVRDPLTAISEELASVEVERQFLEADLEALQQTTSEEQKTTPVPESLIDKAVEQRPEVQQLVAGIAERREKLAHYLRASVRGANDPGVLRLKRAIADNEATLKTMRQDLRETARTDLREQMQAGRREQVERTEASLKNQRLLEKLLKERYAKQREQLQGASGRSVELELARSELSRAEAVFERIAERIVALRTEQRAPPRVTLLERATPPAQPTKMPYSKLAIACFGGFFLPFGLAVIAERRLKRIADPQQIFRETSLAVVGEITTLPARSLVPSRRSRDRFARHCGTFQESIETLGTNLVLWGQLRQLQVIVVASAASREGKTSLAAQLAISLSGSCREPTLLIDADLRAPDLHRRFEVPLAPGVVEVLSGAVPLEQAIVRDLGAHLHLLPAGMLNQSPQGLLGKGALRTLLDTLRPSYRFIVVDAPPVLAASEALFIAREADGTLLCTMRDVSRGGQVKLACERLRAAGVRPLGAVLSGVPLNRYTRTYGGYDTYLRQETSPVGWASARPTSPEPIICPVVPPETQLQPETQFQPERQQADKPAAANNL